MKKSLNQCGVIHTLPLLVIITAIGMISYLLISSTAPIGGLFGILNPKPQSQAQIAPNSFLETFTGAPTSPLPWNPSNWDLTVHTRALGNNGNIWRNYDPMDAHHAANCGRPINDSTGTLITHSLIGNYPDYVFQCADHMMTAANGPEYAVTYFTPNHLVDFSAGEAVIRWDMSTFRSSGRDWIDIWIQPFNNNLALPLPIDLPDLQGHPKDAVNVNLGFPHLNGNMIPKIFRNYQLTNDFPSGSYSEVGYETRITPHPARRDTFELRISKTHLKVCLISANYSAANVGPQGQTSPVTINLCWVDKDIAALPFDKGVVQFGHHSYNPSKDDDATSLHIPNTWHWDNVSISPSKPFTLIKTARRIVVSDEANKTVTFNSPAPANAFLRFSAVGTTEVSFNGGASWVSATRVLGAHEAGASPYHHFPERFSSYFTPIPTGTQSVQFRFSADGWYDGTKAAKDFSIWSEIVSTSTSSPTSTPTSTPTPTPVCTPAFCPSPTSLPGQSCTVGTPPPTSCSCASITCVPITPTPTATASCPKGALGDIDCNGIINIFDYNLIVSNFGRTGSNIQGDIDKNNFVNIFDYNILVTNFGT